MKNYYQEDKILMEKLVFNIKTYFICKILFLLIMINNYILIKIIRF